MVSRKLILSVAVATAVMVALAAPALAQQYPPAANFITVSDPTPVPGQMVTMTAGTFAPGSTVGFTFSSDPVDLGSATASGAPDGDDDDDDDDDDGDNGDGVADGGGVATLNATIPSNAELGTHTITAAGTAPGGMPMSVSTTITVVGSHAGAGTGAVGGPLGAVSGFGVSPGTGVGAAGGLPRTGSDTVPIARIGAALVAVGGGLLFVARRRRAEAGS